MYDEKRIPWTLAPSTQMIKPGQRKNATNTWFPLSSFRQHVHSCLPQREARWIITPQAPQRKQSHSLRPPGCLAEAPHLLWMGQIERTISFRCAQTMLQHVASEHDYSFNLRRCLISTLNKLSPPVPKQTIHGINVKPCSVHLPLPGVKLGVLFKYIRTTYTAFGHALAWLAPSPAFKASVEKTFPDNCV